MRAKEHRSLSTQDPTISQLSYEMNKALSEGNTKVLFSKLGQCMRIKGLFATEADIQNIPTSQVRGNFQIIE